MPNGSGNIFLTTRHFLGNRFGWEAGGIRAKWIAMQEQHGQSITRPFIILILGTEVETKCMKKMDEIKEKKNEKGTIPSKEFFNKGSSQSGNRYTSKCESPLPPFEKWDSENKWKISHFTNFILKLA